MDEQSDEIISETLADIYLAQGMKRKAREMYVKLIQADPDREELKKKLRMATEGDAFENDAELHSKETDEGKIVACPEKDRKTKSADPFPANSMTFKDLDAFYTGTAKERTRRKIVFLKRMLTILTKQDNCR